MGGVDFWAFFEARCTRSDSAKTSKKETETKRKNGKGIEKDKEKKNEKAKTFQSAQSPATRPHPSRKAAASPGNKTAN